jgi:hypothetical protein
MDTSQKIDKLVPLQNKLKMKKKFAEIVQIIINDIKTNIPDFIENQLDCEMILRICNIVEYLVKKKYGVDKKQVVIHVFELLVPDITEANLEFISNTVDFLFNHGQIKPVKMVSKIALGCSELISRKFL